MRISVTALERFRLYRKFDYISDEDMIATVNREDFVVSEKASCGKAFEDAVDFGVSFEDVMPVSVDGYYFAFDTKGVLGVRMALPPDRTRQVKLATEFAGHTLSGVADYVSGSVIHDLKTTDQALSIEKYAESLQWRAYLLMFKGSMFVYDVVVLSQRKGVLYVRDFHQFNLYEYPGMADELQGWVSEYADFAEQVCAV